MYKRNLGFRAIISLVIICIITSTINFHEIEASISSNLPVSYMDENFPDSYKPYIEAMKKKHPNWTFKAVHTGLDWNTVLSHESYEVNEGISLVEDIFSPEWKKDGQNKYIDGSYVYDPLPKPDPELQEPTADELLDILLGTGGKSNE